MIDYRFRILNVFTVGDERLSGNPLCVFEDGRGLEDATMQAIARQLNLSETTFLFPPPPTASDGDLQVSATVRIFTPTFEMPFAGHLTLGTAHVVRALLDGGSSARVTLSMKAGVIEVTAEGDDWSLRTAGSLSTRVPGSREQLAAMIELETSEVLEPALWVDTGAEQLVIPCSGPEAVRRARPNADLLALHGFSARRGASMAYVWAHVPGDAGNVVARFFFLSNGAVVEDPATGSACANLGGWMLATGQSLPFSCEVQQGEQVGRPSRLRLRVDLERRVFVSGRVIEVGQGALTL